MKNNFKYLILVAVLLVVGAVFYYIGHFKYQNTNYAIIETNFVDVNANVSGVISQINAPNNSKVKKGQIIAQIEPDEFIERLDTLNDELDENQQKLKNLNNDYAKLKSLLNQKNEDIKKAQINLENANSDYVLYKIQFKDGTVTKNDLDKASKNIAVAKNNFKIAQDSFKTVSNSTSKTKVQIDNLKNQIENIDNKIESAKLDLKNTALISPIDGIITNNILVEGKSIKQNQKVALIIPKNCYLIAHFDKNKLDKNKTQELKKGQIVTIKTNNFKNRKFKGMVESIENKDREIVVKILFTNNSLSSKTQSKISVKAKIKPKN